MKFPHESERLIGSNSTTKTVGIFSCPVCDFESEYVKARNNHTYCRGCEVPLSDEDHVEKEVRARKCRSCGEKVPLLPDNETSDESRYICFACNNVLMLAIDGQYRDLPEALSLEIIGSTDAMTLVNNVSVTRVSSRREEEAVKVLHTEASEYESSFMAYTPDDVEALLCFVEETAVGYLLWHPEVRVTDEFCPELRQIFIADTDG